jgi:bile acid-coenzyme A ligase
MNSGLDPAGGSASHEGWPLGVHFADLAHRRPDDVAVVADDATLTWSALNRSANRCARALAGHGARTGDLVLLAIPNAAAMVVCFVACWKVGATPMLVPHRSTLGELRALIDLGKPSLLILKGEVAPSMPGALTTAQLLAEEQDDADLPIAIAPSVKAPVSGGSTGQPKLILSTSPGVIDLGGALLYDLDASTVMLMPAPLYHNGPFSAVASALAVGGRIAVMPKFDAEEVLRWIEHERATWVYLVPTMMGRIWRLPEEIRNRYDLSSLKAVWHMAAPCPRWLKAAWIGWLGPDRIFELYGGTESQAYSVITGSEWLSHPGSVGRSMFGEMTVLDAGGVAVEPGEVGEIYMRPPPELGARYRYVGAEAVRRGDWETLGDMGWMDAEGYLYIADRQADMILVGGANIYPAEIEAAIEEHSLVQSCAVVGLPDEDLGNIIHAIVQPRSGLTIEALQQHLYSRLSPQKRPRSFEWVDTPVRDDAGKVRRSALRAARMPATAEGPARGVRDPDAMSLRA